MRSPTIGTTSLILSALGAVALMQCYIARGDDADGASSESEHPAGSIVLRPPSDLSLLVPIPNYSPPKARSSQLDVFAYEYAAHVYSKPKARAPTLGLVRRGTRLRALKRVAARGCKGGAWYALRGAGYACLGRGFTSTQPSLRQPRPDLSRALPFRYGRVNTRKAFRYYRMPGRAEEKAVALAQARRKPLPDFVEKQLDGDYLVAIDRIEKAGDRSFYRTILGRYVRTGEVDLKPEPAMRGESLHGSVRLPLAFVYGEEKVPVLGKVRGRVRPVGTAYKHARFSARRTVRWEGRDVVLAPPGFGVERNHVRIARRHARPAGVTRGQRWIHVDLDEQTLVAYEGDQPVFATLVSSGRDGYETPDGLFRIHEKHKTVTMRGTDPVDGPYEVSEVPWTMYYSGSYALHGAYWHDEFGKTRSHGCTNLSPIDARWLFRFTDGTIPDGWHARRRIEGTQIYLSRDASDTT